MGKGKDRMLTVKEAAAQIGAAEISVRIWAKAGRFPGAKKEDTPMGSYWLIPESAIASFENPGRGRPQKPLSELKNKPRRKAQNN
jgi:hypothetical protein